MAFSLDGGSLTCLMRRDMTLSGTVHSKVNFGQYAEKDLTTQVESCDYDAGPQRVAVRVGGVRHCLYTDHLGSSRVSATGETPQRAIKWLARQHYGCRASVVVQDRLTWRA